MPQTTSLKPNNITTSINPNHTIQDLWLGLWSMGGERFGNYDQANAVKTLEFAYDQFIRHIDTSPFYARGQSDHLLSKFLKNIDRTSVFISSKIGLEWNGNTVIHNAKKKALKETCYQSLDTLKTDYIDLLSLHWPDPLIPIEESIDALRELKDEGVIHHIGVSNFSEEELNEILTEDMYHQLHFNPLHKETLPLLPYTTKNIVYSPLEQGLLSSGICGSGPLQLGKKDIRWRNHHFTANRSLRWRERFHELSLDHFLPKEVIIYLWIFSFQNIHALITGARTVEQLDTTLTYLKWKKLFKLSLEDRSCWTEKLFVIFGKDLFEHLYEGKINTP